MIFMIVFFRTTILIKDVVEIRLTCVREHSYFNSDKPLAANDLSAYSITLNRSKIKYSSVDLSWQSLPSRFM